MKKIFAVFCVLSAFLIMGCGSEEKKPAASNNQTKQTQSVPKAPEAKEVKRENITINGKNGKPEEIEVILKEDGKYYDAKTGERVFYRPNKKDIVTTGGELHKFSN